MTNSSSKNFAPNSYSDENMFYTELIASDYLSVNDQVLITFLKEEITNKQYACSKI